MKDGPAFTGDGIESILGRARFLIVYLLTLGDAVAPFKGGDMLDEYLADTWASIFVELAFREFYRMQLDECADEGFFLSQEYSPGYAGLDLANQAAIFELLKPGAMGLSLTSGFMIVPEKSTSGVIGAAEDDVFVHESPCARCTIRGRCDGRDAKLCGLSR